VDRDTLEALRPFLKGCLLLEKEGGNPRPTLKALAGMPNWNDLDDKGCPNRYGLLLVLRAYRALRTQEA
jgi:hypothetical protein